MNIFGSLFRISIFGESHGECIGCTIDGLPSGFKPDLLLINEELSLRSPRQDSGSTSRHESDAYKILSGYYSDRCTGMPLTVLFQNTDTKSSDYSKRLARPCHADYTASVKYHNCNDIRGGGSFSGRLTAPLVFAGALAKQLLSKYNIKIFSHIQRIGKLIDRSFDSVMDDFPNLDRSFPLIDSSLRPSFESELLHAKTNGDSVGAIVETAVLNLPIGVGEPFFNSTESYLSHILFSIPGVRAIEFGSGFELAEHYASEVNDQFSIGGKTITNHSGGINGGLTNGMPLIFRLCFRPIPSIVKPQSMLDLDTGDTVINSINGRHDVCVVPRGCVVVEACAALAIYDLILQYKLNGAI